MNNNSNLEFRKIPSLEYLYEVNENGTIIRNVKSKRRLRCFKKHHNSNTEYWCVQINIKHKVRKVFLHNAVAECWLGEKPIGLQVDHIDRNSLNNHYTNLRYVTRSEQMLNRDYSKFMDTCLFNLSVQNKGHIVPVRLIRGGRSLEFPTARRATKYLLTIYPDVKEKSFADKFYHRRKRIFDYDVEYIGMQRLDTATIIGKEQSTF